MNKLQEGGLTTRTYSPGEKIRVIRAFTDDRKGRAGLGVYFVAPAEWLCFCQPDGQEAGLVEDVPGNEFVVLQIAPSEFTVRTKDLGDRILLQITQTKFGLYLEEDTETILEEFLDSEVEVLKEEEIDPTAGLNFCVESELREAEAGLDSLTDDQLDAVFRDVIEVRPELLDQLG